MDLNQYNSLSSEHKLALWQRLDANPEFQLLKLIFAGEARARIKVKNMSSKEAFYFEAIRGQAVADVLNHPSDQVAAREKY